MTNKDSVSKLVRAYNNKRDVLRNMKEEINTLSRRLKPMDIDYDKRTRLILRKEELEKKLKVEEYELVGIEQALDVIGGNNDIIQDMTVDEAINIIDGLTLEEFFDHRTAEFLLGKAVHDMRLSYYGTEYCLVEEPVMPEYVDEWIKLNASDAHDDIHDILDDLFHSREDKEISDWVFKNKKNTNTFAIAWILNRSETK